jgi:hypothetical protein
MALHRSTGIERSRATERDGDRVTKFYDSSDKAEAAAEKYRRIAAIDRAGFASPVPRRVLADPDRIEFDLLPARATIDVALTAALRGGDPMAAVELVGDVGRALAIMHDGLTLPRTVERSRSPALRAQLEPGELSRFGPVDSVILHGDFGFSNIWVDDGGGLVVYDPEPSNYTSGAVNTVDFPEIDLATMVTCLAGRTRGARNVLALRRNFAELSDGFLDAYRSARQGDPSRALDRERLAVLVLAQGRAYRSVSSRRSGIAVAALSRWAARTLGRG